MPKYSSKIDETEISPPAPILKVKVSNPHNLKVRGIEKEALIDSGASRTVIPEDFVDKLKILPARKVDLKGYKGNEQTHPTYFVDVSFDNHSFYAEVIAVKRKNVLIGRDILNELKLVLDGKNLDFDIQDP